MQAWPVGDVEADYPAASAGGGDVGKSCLGAGSVCTVMHDDVEAVIRETSSDGAADAFACAGDKDRAGHEMA